MLKNHVKIALRHFLKHKGYSSINILGLAFSMALCMVMLLFVKEQLSRDSFHQNRDRIYRVISHVAFPSNKMDLATSPRRMGALLQENYAGIEKRVTMRRLSSVGRTGERAFTIRGLYAEPSFFDLFSFDLLHGDARTALTSPNAIVLSFEKAQAFFGKADILGERISLEEAGEFVVTGVLAKQTQRTHLQFDALLPFSAQPASGESDPVTEWTNSVFRFYNYFLLEKGTRPAELERAMAEIAQAHYPETLPGKYVFSLQALTGINLGPNLSNKIGSKAPNELIYAMAALVLIIMLTACFNYVNLTVARALKRSLEVGIRKVIGAGRFDIVRQLLSEAILFALASALLAIVLLDWLIPAFNNLSMIGSASLQINPAALGDPTIYLMFAGFAVFVGLLAGLYPAVLLSKARPVAALQGFGKTQRPQALSLRKTLLVMQFALSFVFIAFTLQLERQVEYMLSEDYGFEREHIINVELQESVSFETFRNEALKLPEVIEVSATSILPVSGEQESTVFKTRFLEKPVGMLYYSVDARFAENLALRFVAGENFSEHAALQVLMNESAVKRLGFSSPATAIGERVGTADGQEGTVVGVVKDFHFEKLNNPIQPLLLTCIPQLFRFANVRVHAGMAPAAVQQLEKTWKSLDSIHPFRYAFFENQIAQNYAEFRDATRLLGLAACLVVLIASLGLLGIATYKIESKTKEIGIRKVLGATVESLRYE